MPNEEVVVRVSTPEDVRYAQVASALIERASHQHEIATRSPEELAEQIRLGNAVIALIDGELIGFGYFKVWSDLAISHSGLVVEPQFRGRKIGKRLKLLLCEESERRVPDGRMISLTTSPQVRHMNTSLEFRVVPLVELTIDPKFWAGCRGCHNFASVNAPGSTEGELTPTGDRCCCEGMCRRNKAR